MTNTARWGWALVVFICLVMISVTAGATPPQVGEAAFTRGVVTAAPEGGEVRFLGKGTPLYEKDVITVAKRSFALIRLSDGTRITLRPDTVFSLEEYSDRKGKENALFRLFRGGLRAIAGFIARPNPKNGFRIKTPTAVLGVRGTEFDARLCEGDCAAEAERIQGKKSAAPPPRPAGRVFRLKGTLTARDQDGKIRRLLKGAPLFKGDTLETGPGAVALLVFRDDSRVTLLGNSAFTVEKYRYEKKRGNAFLRLLRGGIRVFTGLLTRRSPRAFKVGTPTAVIGVRGTGFDVRLCEDGCAAGGRSARVAAGRIVRIQGRADARTHDGTRRRLSMGSPVYEGDTLETGTDGYAVVVFRDNSRVTLQAETAFTVEKYRYKKKRGNAFLRLLRGGIRVFTGFLTRRSPERFKIGTPTAVIGVRGTGFDLQYRARQAGGEKGVFAYVWKTSRHAIVMNRRGKAVLLAPGKAAFLPPSGKIIRLPAIPVFMIRNPAPRPDPATVPADPKKLFGTGAGQYVHVWDGAIDVELKSGKKMPLEQGRTLFWPKGAAGPVYLPMAPLFMAGDGAWRPDRFKVDLKGLFGETAKTGTPPGLYVSVYDGHVRMESEGGVIELGKGEAGFCDRFTHMPVRLSAQPLFQVRDVFPRPGAFKEEDAGGILQHIMDESGGCCEKKGVECEIR